MLFDRRTNNHDLNIQRYTITLLFHNAAGEVGWGSEIQWELYNYANQETIESDARKG